MEGRAASALLPDGSFFYFVGTRHGIPAPKINI
jgi:hypothetical protein